MIRPKRKRSASRSGRRPRAVRAGRRDSLDDASPFRAVFELAVNGFLLADAKTRRLSMPNPRMLAMLGYTEDELNRLCVPDIHPPEDLQAVLRQFRLLVSGAITLAKGVPVKRKDGSVFMVDIAARPIRLGGRRYVLGTFHDVTERMAMDRALAESESRLRTIMDSTADAIFVKDARRRYTFVNAAMARLLGCRTEDLVGRTPAQVFGRAGARIVRETDDTTFAGRTYDAERTLRLGGRDYVLHTVQTPIRGPDGRVGSICGIVRDVTARVAAEKALRESEARYRQMVEAIPMLAWRASADGRVVEMNSRWGAYTGQAPEESMGLGWMKALHPTDRRMASGWGRDEARGVAVLEAEHRLRRASDGRYRWHLVRAMPVRDDSGTIMGWVGAATDIEHQKRVEDELERRVKSRTAELLRANRMLAAEVVERKRLELEVLEAAEGEQRRIGSDLHDGLAQVLAAVGYGMDGLRIRLGRAKSAEAPYVRKLAESLRSALAQTRQLSQALHPVPPTPDGLVYALAGLSTMVSEMFRVRCRFACARLVAVPDATRATHLFRIAQEAVHNAVRHGKASEIRIALQESSGAVVLAVRDNGKGFRVRGARRGSLGLGTMRYRAEAVGGTLAITSGREGTVVECRMPQPAAPPPSRVAARPHPARAG